MTSVRRGPVAAFLFSSGACALIYQVVWTREFRLIFGASTTASAAVLAIFIGGLGLGGLVLGGKADRHAKPLMLYANLEAAIAIAAALTPLLLGLAQKIYLGIGGATTLGEMGATALRLVLSVAVLGVPTFLMGGTLPAAVRAAQADDDAGRRHAAFLYGANTMGAVAGSVLATFVAMEVFGAKLSLWIACALNLLVAMIARMVARSGAFVVLGAPAKGDDAREAAAPATFVLVAALLVGFVFFLMELVWYRMLAPLLGGSVYTFGLILGVALLGIGLGGLTYALAWGNRPATLTAFATTSLLEAAAIALPFALGDRIAVAALGLRSLSAWGFSGLVAGWGAIALVVVFPAAFASGVQFPLLIALLGRGKAGVGRHLGLTYAWNTVGAILGSLAGGFGLLPALSATGSWRFVAVALTAVGLAAAGLAVSRKMDVLRAGAAAAIALVVGGLLTADGPTAAWRHSPIGAGRVGLDEVGTPFLARRWLAYQRSKISWQKEGREVTVGLSTVNDRSFIVSGKADGSFRMDVATQVMFPLVGACLHGGPKNAYIIGLGSGSSAGWMADFPGVEHVDVAEIEPAIVDIAGFAKSVNRDVLANKKVHVELLDAREGLLTKKHRYDLIASEPSNPYRAGISSLFTEEYYRAVEQRLAKGGLFLQWMQAYEVDARTIRSIYATLGSVFPHIETWMLDPGDILLVASREPIQKDVAKLRACVEAEPVREAMLRSWDTTTLEGFLSHHVARPSFAEHVKKVHGALPLNTDDLNPLEFGVARTVGRQLFDVVEMQALSTARKERRPEMIGKVDWALVEEEATSYLPRTPPGGFAKPVADRAGRAAAATAAGRRDFAEARSLYQTAGPPVTIHQRLLVAFALAALGDDAALELVAPLAATHEGEIAAIKCRLALTKRDPVVAVAEMKKALASMQASPWFHFRTGQLFVTTIPDVAALARNDAPEIFELLKKKNAGELYEFGRREALTKVAMIAGLDARCRDVAEVWEPNPPWERDVLLLRAHCFEVLHDRRAKAARADADQFVSMESESLDPGAAAAPREAPAERKAPAEQRPAPSP